MENEVIEEKENKITPNDQMPLEGKVINEKEGNKEVKTYTTTNEVGNVITIIEEVKTIITTEEKPTTVENPNNNIITSKEIVYENPQGGQIKEIINEQVIKQPINEIVSEKENNQPKVISSRKTFTSKSPMQDEDIAPKERLSKGYTLHYEKNSEYQKEDSDDDKNDDDYNSLLVSEMLSQTSHSTLSSIVPLQRDRTSLHTKNIIITFNRVKEEEEENNNISFNKKKDVDRLSLSLIIFKIFFFSNGNYHNIRNEDFIKYFIYQKPAIISNEVFIDILSFLIDSNCKDTVIKMLNYYLVNHYKTEISNDKQMIDILCKLYSKFPLENNINFYSSHSTPKEIISTLKNKNKFKSYEKILKFANQQDLTFSYQPINPFIPESFGDMFNIHIWPPVEIARQISLITQFIFHSIDIKEILNCNWTKKDKVKNSPNVTKMINRFDFLSHWICEEILSYDHARGRAKAIEKFICIAEELSKIKNYNDCFNIISSFNFLPLKRLTKSWGKVRIEYLHKLRSLSELCSLSQNWGNLRSEYQKYKALNDEERKTGCIPYLGYFLKDLAFSEEGGKYLNDKQLLSIEKIIKCGKVIDELRFFQRFVYNYKPIFGLAFLSECVPLNEDDLTDISKKLEPKFILSASKGNRKRKTQTDLKYVENKGFLPQTFKDLLNYIREKDFEPMTLKEKLEILNNKNK